MTETVVKLPPAKRAGELRAESFDKDTYTIDLVWTTGAAVRRYSLIHDEEYDECLSLDNGAVRLERLNLGAPFCDTHSTSCLDDVLGSVVPGSARIENGRGLCTVKLSRAKGVADSVQKIAEGVIRNVSVGYYTHKIIRTEGDDNTVARWDVVDWEPLEISAVPVPADSGSQIRSETPQGNGDHLRSCVLVNRTAAKGTDPEATGQSDMAEKLDTTADRLAAFRAAVGTDETALAATRAAKREEEDKDEERDDEADEERAEDVSTEDQAEARAEDDEDKDERDGDDEDDKSEERAEGDDDEDEDEDEDKGERAAPTQADIRRLVQEGIRADRERARTITELAARAGLPKFGKRHAEGETSVKAFRGLLLDKLIERQAKRSPALVAATATQGVSDKREVPAGKSRVQREMEEAEAHFGRLAAMRRGK